MDTTSYRAIRAALRGFVLFFGVIFIPAWTLDYWQGWAFFLTLAICTSLATIYMARNDKQLLESRLNIGPAAETTTAQKIVTALGAPLFVVAIVTMVLDHRFGWSPSVPAIVSICRSAWNSHIFPRGQGESLCRGSHRRGGGANGRHHRSLCGHAAPYV